MARRREGGNVTTKNSPKHVLQAQANKITNLLKAAERGERIDVAFAAKVHEARNKPAIKIGVVMDDKIITLEIPWATIRETTEAGLAEYILGLMRESRDTIN